MVHFFYFTASKNYECYLFIPFVCNYINSAVFIQKICNKVYIEQVKVCLSAVAVL